MLAWVVITVVLLIWAAIHASMRMVADFRGPKPASGVWGLFALAGILSALLLFAVGFGVAISGV